MLDEAEEGAGAVDARQDDADFCDGPEVNAGDKPVGHQSGDLSDPVRAEDGQDGAERGEDQRQHVELCRDIGARFNNSFPDTFKLPEAFIPKMGARIMSHGNPENKMSKSDPDGCVFLMDKPEDIMRKFKRAVTDCETTVRFDKDNKPGISNLLTIYCAATGKTIEQAEAEFADQGYGVFKPAVGEAVVELVRPIREKTEQLLADKTYLESIYKEGAERASYLANKTLRKVYKKVGFVAR